MPGEAVANLTAFGMTRQKTKWAAVLPMGVVSWVSLKNTIKSVLNQIDTGDTPSASPARAYLAAIRRASASVSWYWRIQRRSIQSFSVHSQAPSTVNNPRVAMA